MEYLNEVKRRVQSRGARQAYNDYALLLDYCTGEKARILTYKLFIISALYLSLIVK